MSPDQDDLQVETVSGRATVTLSRPDRRNPLSSLMLSALNEALDDFASRAEVRVIVIRAAGPVFCAGHDLKEVQQASEAELRSLFELCSTVMQKLRAVPQPVIAQVQGMATAAGCQLVAASDLAVASEDAAFATPGVRIGLFCTTPMVPLVRSIPARAAMEMLLTGQPISAQRAYELGLVNRVVPADRLDAEVEALAGHIASFSPEVQTIGKRAFYETLQQSEGDAYEHASEVMTQNALLDDATEGISAFLEKRQPVWKAND